MGKGFPDLSNYWQLTRTTELFQVCRGHFNALGRNRFQLWMANVYGCQRKMAKPVRILNLLKLIHWNRQSSRGFIPYIPLSVISKLMTRKTGSSITGCKFFVMQLDDTEKEGGGECMMRNYNALFNKATKGGLSNTHHLRRSEKVKFLIRTDWQLGFNMRK